MFLLPVGLVIVLYVLRQIFQVKPEAEERFVPRDQLIDCTAECDGKDARNGRRGSPENSRRSSRNEGRRLKKLAPLISNDVCAETVAFSAPV